MIPCSEVIRVLWDFLDGELSAERTDEIRRHLEICAGCRAVTEFEEEFLRSVRRLLDVPPPRAELRARVVAALRAHGFENGGG